MKTILITGASSGIGLATAKKLSLRPCKLILIARNLSRLEKVRNQLLKSGHSELKVDIVCASVTNFEDLSNELEGMAVSIDCLIHSAGKGLAHRFEDTSLEDMNDIMNTNFMGAVHITKAVLPLMKQKGSGRIIFISSVAGLLGIYGYTAYSASKFALEGFVQSLRNELAGSNISVGVVYPPDVDTPMYEEENKTKPLITKKISGGILLTPEDIANCICENIETKRFRIFPGLLSRINCFFIAHFPRLAFFYIDFVAKMSK